MYNQSKSYIILKFPLENSTFLFLSESIGITILFLTLNDHSLFRFNEKIQIVSFRHRMSGDNCLHVTQHKTVNQPVKIIFDTDFGPDYDDVGALAFLHAMADSGKAEILATVSSNQYELVAPCINIMNIYFNRPDLPIGSPKSHGVSMSASQHWPDTLVAKYPHTVMSNCGCA